MGREDDWVLGVRIGVGMMCWDERQDLHTRAKLTKQDSDGQESRVRVPIDWGHWGCENA